MRLAPFALVALALAACASDSPLAPDAAPQDLAFSATTSSHNIIADFSGGDYVPCGNDGNGEFVDLAGRLHTKVTTVEQDGRTMEVVQVNPMGVVGVGLESGVRYQGTGNFHARFEVTGDDLALTSINNFRLIAPDAPSLRVHVITHIRMEGGEVATEVELSKITCR